MQHYYSRQPKIESNVKTATYAVNNNLLTLQTDAGVFSRLGIDFGSRLLIENVNVNDGQKVLDLGCGNGVIGISLAKSANIELTMCDVNLRALELSSKNSELNQVKAKIIESDAVSNIDEIYDVVVTNPPIRAGKDVVFSFYEGAHKHLTEDGVLYVVIQKKQGAPSTIKKLETLFESVQIIAKDKGYYIIESRKPLLSQ
ncbi:MAG: class I SAM-dependent methyltransferase [Culicoidibacterales bacterium]